MRGSRESWGSNVETCHGTSGSRGSKGTFSLIVVQGYEKVLPYVLEDEPMSMLLKALIDKGFRVVQ
ncbi:hypothetical protein MC7420_7108 [Coleofasciculus chthonoplastes PCC 7420]|uniref:Uncharacterized protein n=1 Tax=Coleofasciculus chthonoplastes PCC 7420 TaxID=118168 RepID=B4VHI9_9CYAN|nr:hypothetical protein MC7420_7108 [Coleofasciculus chthonoplastes PCC 7420]